MTRHLASCALLFPLLLLACDPASMGEGHAPDDGAVPRPDSAPSVDDPPLDDAGTTPSSPTDGGVVTACGEPIAVAPLFATAADARPLTWRGDDGAIFTRMAGRVRARHENEERFSIFPRHYFEHRTFEMIVEDTIPAGGSSLRVTWRPTRRNRGPNLRVFYTGEGNLFVHNVTMDEHARADGSFEYTYEITRNHRTNAPLAAGDVVELELGVFLEYGIEGDTNYYSDVYRMRVGEPGIFPLTERGDDVRSDDPVLSAGDATIPAIVVERELAFSQYALTLPHEDLVTALEGRRVFHSSFVDGHHDENLGPALPSAMGLAGPRLAATECSSCHVRNGRGLPPEQGATSLGGTVLRLADAADPTRAHPALGAQLQERALDGAPEGSFAVRWESVRGAYADGTEYELRRPVWTVGDALVSARVAPAVPGLGLLEAIAEDTIVALADPDDCDTDGIRGRPNLVVDPADGLVRLGRFGWRASKATIAHQSAAAFAGDLGVTSSLVPRGDCGDAQTCADEGIELADEDLARVVAYLRGVGVPPRRDVDAPSVRRGAEVFASLGCESCHTATIRTGSTHPVIAFRDQTIHPYTDLLLHDLGEGLADPAPEGDAEGYEWRTPPLWGIGLTAVISGVESYLHDGRARDLAEAILWHGGEAQRARDGFVESPREDREALVTFLRSL